MLIQPGGIVRSWQRGINSMGVVVTSFVLLGVCLFGVPTAVLIIGVREINKPADEPTSPDDNAASRSDYRFPLKEIALGTGMALLIWAVAGRFLQPARVFAKRTPLLPKIPRGEIQRLSLEDGSEIYLEANGPSDAPTIILTHGWSLNHRQWVRIRHDLGDRFRVVVWDIPGLGESKPPANYDFSLDNMARQLKAVVDASGPGPIVLVGHSIGGMIQLTFCRLFPDLVGERVSKLVLLHGTYTNPVLTMAKRSVLERLQKPLIEPLLHLQIVLWPVVWCFNWLTVWNGLAHRAIADTCFSKKASRRDLDFVAGFYALGSPAILARGSLAMLAFDETATLPEINIPVLVVGGADDPLTLGSASELMHQRLPRAKLTMYNPGKHFGFMEYHSDFATTLADFCSS